jgi:hypothetical protein
VLNTITHLRNQIKNIISVGNYNDES